MTARERIINSYKRLYAAGKITQDKLNQMLADGKITQDEYNYIVG